MIKLQFRRNKTLIITAKTNKQILKVSISVNLMQNNLTKNYSRRKIITARSFSSSVSKFWQTSPFFLHKIFSKQSRVKNQSDILDIDRL